MANGEMANEADGASTYHVLVSFLTRAASPRLAAVVERLWYVEDAQPTGDPETICPDGCPEIVIHLGEAMQHQPRFLLVGQMAAPLTIVPTGPVIMVGARLAPAGLHRLLPMPQERGVGRIFPLESVWSTWTRCTAERVSAARSPLVALDVFERAIEALIPPEAKAASDVHLEAAIATLRARAGHVAITRLADDAGVSRRHFERCFRERVGLSPRLYARIVRFQRAFQALGTESGAIIAARYGYADQAHLVREIRRFAGITPTALAEADGLTAFFRQ